MPTLKDQNKVIEKFLNNYRHGIVCSENSTYLSCEFKLLVKNVPNPVVWEKTIGFINYFDLNHLHASQAVRAIWVIGAATKNRDDAAEISGFIELIEKRSKSQINSSDAVQTLSNVSAALSKLYDKLDTKTEPHILKNINEIFSAYVIGGGNYIAEMSAYSQELLWSAFGGINLNKIFCDVEKTKEGLVCQNYLRVDPIPVRKREIEEVQFYMSKQKDEKYPRIEITKNDKKVIFHELQSMKLSDLINFDVKILGYSIGFDTSIPSGYKPTWKGFNIKIDNKDLLSPDMPATESIAKILAMGNVIRMPEEERKVS